MASILTKWGYFHNNMVFRYKVLSLFIIHQGLSFGGFALKIEFVLFVYELINYLFMNFFLLLGYVTSTSDPQPSTATANQLPNQLISTQIRTIYRRQGKIVLNSLLYIIALTACPTQRLYK